MSDRLHERWREPVIPLAVRDDETTVTMDTGRETLDVQMRFKASDIERFRLGYACINCLEPFERPFPETCNVCSYRVRERQPADFLEKFKGLERDPKALKIFEGLDRVDDTHERNFYVNKNGILVPKGVPVMPTEREKATAEQQAEEAEKTAEGWEAEAEQARAHVEEVDAAAAAGAEEAEKAEEKAAPKKAESKKTDNG